MAAELNRYIFAQKALRWLLRRGTEWRSISTSAKDPESPRAALFINTSSSISAIFTKEVAPRFLAWDVANAKAWDVGEKQTEWTMDG